MEPPPSKKTKKGRVGATLGRLGKRVGTLLGLHNSPPALRPVFTLVEDESANGQASEPWQAGARGGLDVGELREKWTSAEGAAAAAAGHDTPLFSKKALDVGVREDSQRLYDTIHDADDLATRKVRAAAAGVPGAAGTGFGAHGQARPKARSAFARGASAADNAEQDGDKCHSARPYRPSQSSFVGPDSPARPARVASPPPPPSPAFLPPAALSASASGSSSHSNSNSSGGQPDPREPAPLQASDSGELDVASNTARLRMQHKLADLERQLMEGGLVPSGSPIVPARQRVESRFQPVPILEESPKSAS